MTSNVATSADMASAARSPEQSGTALRNDPSAQFGYIYGLDGLRLLAVAIVIIRHYELVMQLPGGFGVSIFFFISGFLITRLLLAEEKRQGTIGLRAFYIRRFIRLLPPLLLMGIVSVPLLYLLYPQGFSAGQVILAFLYLGNISKFGSAAYGWSEGYKSLEPLWSLAVEEHFYLLLPPCLMVVKSFRGRVTLLAGAIVVPLILRIWTYHQLPLGLADQANYHFTPMRLDAMAWGVLLTLLLDKAVIRQETIDRHAHALVWGGGILMIASMVHYSPLYEVAIKYTPQSLAIGIFFTGLILARPYGWARQIMEWKPIVHLGRRTYELYLWHFPVLAVVACFVPRALAVPIALVASVIVAELAFGLTTKRLSALRRRFGGHPVS